MKRIVLFLMMALLSATLCAQTYTDKDGNKVYNGSSMAIFTRISKYSVGGNADITKATPGEFENEMKIAFNTMATSAAQSQGIQIVNRDDAMYKATQAWIEESKSEDYIDGIAVQAKHVGATHIMIQDITFYTYGNVYMVIEILSNVLCVQTNISSKVCKKYSVPIMGSSNDISNMIAAQKAAYREYFMYSFPGFFALQGCKGKTASLALTSLFGVDTSDKVCFYEWKTVSGYCGGSIMNFSKMKLKAIGTEPKAVNGLLQVKLDHAIDPKSNYVIKLGDISRSEMNTYYHVPLALVDLRAVENTIDGYCKRQINNATYNAIYNLPCINLIESKELSVIKKERELQKTEEFIDRSVIKQFKASGARYIMRLSDYSQLNRVVSLKLCVVEIESRRIEKEFSIKCHISNIDEVMNYYVNQIFVSPIAVGAITNKQITVYPAMPLAVGTGEPFSILFNKPIRNPMTGETIYNRIDFLSGRLIEWNGQEYVIRIEKIFDKEDFAKISSGQNTGLLYLQKDLPEPADPLKDNSSNMWKK